MNIYMLLIDDERSFFYSAEQENTDEGIDEKTSPARPAKGWSGRFVARFQQRLLDIKRTWENAEGGFLGRARHWWDWLHSFVHPQESMLIRFYGIKKLDLFYPASRNAEIRSIWQGYLKGRFWRHAVWCAVNSIVCVFTAILAILPGPNLIGYWFLYRAIHHAMIVLGIRRVLRDKVRTTFIATESLNHTVHKDSNGQAAHSFLGDPRHRERLHVYYEWANGERRRLFVKKPKPVSNDPGDGSTAHESS